MKRILIPAALVLALSACGPSEADLRAAAEAEKAQKEQAAADLAKKYDDALATENWELARVHGAAVLAQYADTQAAAKVKASIEETTSKAEAKREEQRLRNLWAYVQVPVRSGEQRSAVIYSKDTVDVDGSGARRVQLVFRDHPEWKRHAYLVLETGDFDCYGGCRVKVVADGKTHDLPASRPKTDEAIAMFIEDHRALWRLAGKSKSIEIEFPVKAGGTRKAVFETGGLDPTRMPGWG